MGQLIGVVEPEVDGLCSAARPSVAAILERLERTANRGEQGMDLATGDR